MIGPNQIIQKFLTIAQTDPRISGFGYGPLYDLQSSDINYCYLWIINEDAHTVNYSDINKYRSVEYAFTLRVGDKVNNQPNVYNAIGQNSNNGLEIINDTFLILLDIINVISEDSIGLFTELSLIDDISIEPFFNEDNGDVNGHQADIILRVKIENPCDNPITDVYGGDPRICETETFACCVNIIICTPIFRDTNTEYRCFEIQMAWDSDTNRYVGQVCQIPNSPSSEIVDENLSENSGDETTCADFFIEFIEFDGWFAYVVIDGETTNLASLGNGLETDCPIGGEENEIGELTWRILDGFYTIFGKEATFDTIRREPCSL